MWALPKRYLLLPLPLFTFYMAFPDPLFQSLRAHYPFPLAFLCIGGLLLYRESDLTALAKTGHAASGTAPVPSVPSSHGQSAPASGPAPGPDLGRIPVGRALMTCAFATLRSLVPEAASLLINAAFTTPSHGSVPQLEEDVRSLKDSPDESHPRFTGACERLGRGG